jgi:hypothetical protein
LNVDRIEDGDSGSHVHGSSADLLARQFSAVVMTGGGVDADELCIRYARRYRFFPCSGEIKNNVVRRRTERKRYAELFGYEWRLALTR